MTYATVEEARQALLTHVCRFRPNLRLNPRHCEKRQVKSNGRLSGANPLDAGQFSPYWQCRDCEGPLPGAGLPEFETNQKEVTEVKNEKPESPVDEPGYEPEDDMLCCPFHGEYRPWKIGSQTSTKCPVCTREKKVATQRATRKAMTSPVVQTRACTVEFPVAEAVSTLNPVPNTILSESHFADYPELLTQIRQLAKEELRSPAMQILWYLKIHLGNMSVLRDEASAMAGGANVWKDELQG